MKKLPVFISHITEEKEVAAALKRLVEAHFLNLIDVFVSSDSTSVHLGRRWFDDIITALKECHVAIILASPESVKRPWVNFEGGAAYLRGIPVIPLCHSGMTPSKLPAPLNTLQAATASVEAELKAIFPVLAAALGGSQPTVDFSEFIGVVKKFEEDSRQMKALKDSMPVTETDGLAQHELATLVEVAEQSATPGQNVAVGIVRTAMENAGYRAIAVGLSLNKLSREDFVETSMEPGWNNDEYPVVMLTPKGWTWLESHTDLISLRNPANEESATTRGGPPRRKTTKNAEVDKQQFTEDDIPF